MSMSDLRWMGLLLTFVSKLILFIPGLNVWDVQGITETLDMRPKDEIIWSKKSLDAIAHLVTNLKRETDCLLILKLNVRGLPYLWSWMSLLLAHIGCRRSVSCWQGCWDPCLFCTQHIWKPVQWKNPELKEFVFRQFVMWDADLLILGEEGPHPDQPGQSWGGETQEDSQQQGGACWHHFIFSLIWNR